MATNEVTTLRNGIVAVLEADATIQTLAGRATEIVKLPDSIADAARPAFVYHMGSNQRIGGSSHPREVFVILEAYARGNGSQDTVEAMTRRAREALTKAALVAQGVSLIELQAVERGVDALNEDGTFSQDARHDLELLIELTAPL